MRMLRPIAADIAWPRHAHTPTGVFDVLEDFDTIVGTFLRPTSAKTTNFQSSCDVSETKDHYLISFDIPGVKKENIKILVQGDRLSISGERQRMIRDQEGDSTLHVERTCGKFERTFTLPTTIASDKIEALYENGVLNVALPKAEAATGRTIQIQTGHDSWFSKLLGSKKDANKEIKDVKSS